MTLIKLIKKIFRKKIEYYFIPDCHISQFNDIEKARQNHIDRLRRMGFSKNQIKSIFGEN